MGSQHVRLCEEYFENEEEREYEKNEELRERREHQ